MTIWMIRHAQSQSNAGQATIGPDDNGLSQLGYSQASFVAEAIHHPPDWIATSSYWRTQLTAKPLLDKFPQTRTEIWSIHEFSYLSFPLGQPTTPFQRQPLSQAYWDRCDPDYIDGERAESFQQLIARPLRYLRSSAQQTLDRICQHQGFGVVFSHSLFMKTLLWVAMARPTSINTRAMQRFTGFWRSFPVPNASILKIEVSADQQLSWSEFSVEHLPPNLQNELSPLNLLPDSADQPS
jgi:broad specificity phosphatase PhoE